MKPELVFPLIVASYSEDKIAMELLNNDSMIKTAWKLGNIGKFFSGSKAKQMQRTPLLWSEELKGEAGRSIDDWLARNKPRSSIQTKTNVSSPASPGNPRAAKSKQFAVAIHALVKDLDAAGDLNALNEILRINNLDTEDVKKALPLVKKFMDNNTNINNLRRNPRFKKRVAELNKEQTEIINKLQAMGFNSDDLNEIKNLPLDKLEQVINKINNLNDVTSKGQAAGNNQAGGSQNTPDANQAAGNNQAAGTNQASTTDKNEGSNRLIDLINSLVVGGSIFGAGHQIAQSLQKDENTRKEILVNNALTARGQAAGLTAPTDQRTEADQGDGPPKQQIPPLLAAGLGALLIGGLAQRRYGNEEGRYDSLGDSLLPMLAGGLVGYGGAEAINRYSA